MSRTLAVLACLIVGADCVKRGTGIEAQNIFGAGYEWLWLVTAAGWLWVAIDMVSFKKAK